MGSALLAAILSVCQEWSATLPPLTQVPGDIELSLHAIKNTRRKMEDKYAVCVDINSLFGLKVCACVETMEIILPHACVAIIAYASSGVCLLLVGLPSAVVLRCV